MSRLRESPSPRAIASGVSTATRAAASSKASGIPSSCRQISAIAHALSSLRRQPRSTRPARSMNRRVAAGSESVGTSQRISPRIASGMRLVARIESDEHAPSSAEATRATSPTRCSQLSITSSACRSRRNAIAVSSSPRPGSGCKPSVCTSVDATAPPSSSPASSTHHTPPGKLPALRAAASIASRVLPTPPAPVSVNRRADDTLAATASRADSRPISVVSCAGRLCGVSFLKRPSPDSNPKDAVGSDSFRDAASTSPPWMVGRP